MSIVEHICYLSHPQLIIAIANILIISLPSLPFVGEKVHDKCQASCKVRASSLFEVVSEQEWKTFSSSESQTFEYFVL